MIKVLMVCTGNICRSPMAQYVLQDRARKERLAEQVVVDSAGISNEEVGNVVSRGTVDMLKQHGIPHDARRPARQVAAVDFTMFDYLLAMDHSHLNYLQRHAGSSDALISLFLQAAVQAGKLTRADVPDPYYDGQYGRTYDLVTKGCAAFFESLRAEHNL
jgi:protein-tyrosine phosphatase